jgi:hypothetical protein
VDCKWWIANGGLQMVDCKFCASADDVILYTLRHLTFKDEAQTALFKDPVRTAQ